MSLHRFKIVIYVPLTHEQAVKQAGPTPGTLKVFQAGAGQIGAYKDVSFSTPGTGGFTPLEGAHPAIGSVGKGETVDEVRIEVTAVGTEVVREAVRRVKAVHPYEEVVVDVYRLEEF
ncbi:hypothetical protein QFC19_007657 [Naganishia cerealis]|uniref:Uncharacterized protein n=1 Tax=Naganishia cerealis TaxID=610337 RepID=A0ACC2V899_9TREE|nr:hypothetical protein QFC19_007657 [Naganishia cerealis]